MVPEGWKVQCIGEIAEVKGGKRLPKGELLVDENTGFPYIRVADLYDGGICLSSIKYVPKNVAPKISQYRINKDDIFITVAGTLGMVGEVPENLDGANLTENADKLTSIKCNKKFLVEVLRSSIVQKYINQEKTQNAQPKLALTRIRNFRILVPPIAEQRKIAKILSTWDEAIATIEQILAISEQQKKGLMQQLLTSKKRLPGFEGKWIETTLGELFSERKESGISNLALLSVTSDQGIINRDDVGRKDTSSADKSRYLRVCPGDIAYNTMRMWQGVSALSDLEGIVSPAYTVLKPKSEMDSRYAAYLFKMPRMVHRFFRHSQGLVSDTWNLKYKQFAKIRVVVPELEEQKAIAEVLSKEDETIRCLGEQIKQLKLEKKALMQQLLTGRRRVKVDEAERVSA